MANEHYIHIKGNLYNYKGQLLDSRKEFVFPEPGNYSLTDYNVPATAGLTLYVCPDVIQAYQNKLERNPDYFKVAMIRRVVCMSNDTYRQLQDKSLEQLPKDYALVDMVKEMEKNQSTFGGKTATEILQAKANQYDVRSNKSTKGYLDEQENKLGNFLKRQRTR